MKALARERYRWSAVAAQWTDLFRAGLGEGRGRDGGAELGGRRK